MFGWEDVSSEVAAVRALHDPPIPHVPTTIVMLETLIKYIEEIYEKDLKGNLWGNLSGLLSGVSKELELSKAPNGKCDDRRRKMNELSKVPPERLGWAERALMQYYAEEHKSAMKRLRLIERNYYFKTNKKRMSESELDDLMKKKYGNLDERIRHWPPFKLSGEGNRVDLLKD
ncbi:hypothetical protein AJ79_09322 [Helicocarpus griseus UAMH5409]|uniref:Uncharacterized protein n=1 Tax=Helicocarpus griseus UAMH5409 TaxID=1447875 RepID=A0A2B7WKV0_9EURO|nr:hypothetical protein AJ79_09322 [Helicocarpus griseus UAMH5409]